MHAWHESETAAVRVTGSCMAVHHWQSLRHAVRLRSSRTQARVSGTLGVRMQCGSTHCGSETWRVQMRAMQGEIRAHQGGHGPGNGSQATACSHFDYLRLRLQVRDAQSRVTASGKVSMRVRSHWVVKACINRRAWGGGCAMLHALMHC